MGRFKGLGYPCMKFWEIAAEEGVTCVLGVDAHEPAHLLNCDLFDKSALMLKEMGLERKEMLL